MKKSFKGSLGCLVICIGILLLLFFVGAFEKYSAQPKIEQELIKKLDLLNAKLEQANEKEKESLIYHFLYVDRTDFNRVNIIDNTRRRLFEEIHQVLNDYNLILKIKIKAPEVKFNEQFLIESLAKTYRQAEKIQAEDPEYDERKLLESKIRKKFKSLLKSLEENSAK
jgi:hypothetical protein